MNILQVCAYAADYEGNFMKSLYALETQLNKQGHRVFYAFSDDAKDKDWCIQLRKRTKVFFLPLKRARILPKTYILLKKIIKENDVKVVHSHFELYDIPCNMMSSKKVKVFWHLHDPIKKSGQKSRNILNKLQYSVFSKNVKLLSVSDFYKNIVIDFGFRKENAFTVLNGIDLLRISYPYSNKIKYDFLTFGWDFERKGSDVIFSAMKKLADDGYNFKLLFNCNEQTVEKINLFFNDRIPEWLEIGMPVENVNDLFSVSTTFIQASRRETFSYAVCEASYAGRDVISSDIAGLEWARSLPTVEFFENENIDALYKLLKKRLDKRVSISKNDIKNSREQVENNFSTEVWAKNIMKYYEM